MYIKYQLLVIWFCSQKMSKTVYRKCHIGKNHKSQYTTDSNCFHPAFVPTKHRYKHRQYKTANYFETPVVSIRTKKMFVIHHINI